MTKADDESSAGAAPPPSDTELEPPRSSAASQLQSNLLLEVVSSFSGPLPPPRTLAAYDDVAPGSADRIIRMAESEGDHRRAIERSELDANVKAQTRGQYLAFVVAISVSMGGIYLLATDHGVGGLVALLTPLAALAGVFLVGRFRRKEQRQTQEALKDLRAVVDRHRKDPGDEGNVHPLSETANDSGDGPQLAEGESDARSGRKDR